MARNNEEIDDLKVKETVTVRAVLFFLGFLFAILVLFLFYLRYSNFSPLAEIYHKKPEVPEVNLTQKVVEKTRETESGQKFQLKVTDAELADAAATNSSSFPLKDGSIKITSSGLKVAGKTKNTVIGIGVSLLIVPKVENGKIAYEMTEIKAGGVTAPGAIREPIASALDQKLATLLPLQKNYTIESLFLYDGYLIINATKI